MTDNYCTDYNSSTFYNSPKHLKTNSLSSVLQHTTKSIIYFPSMNWFFLILAFSLVIFTHYWPKYLNYSSIPTSLIHLSQSQLCVFLMRINHSIFFQCLLYHIIFSHFTFHSIYFQLSFFFYIYIHTHINIYNQIKSQPPSLSTNNMVTSTLMSILSNISRQQRKLRSLQWPFYFEYF